MIRQKDNGKVVRTPFEHAELVQRRRVMAGLRGYAKAVRRYLKRLDSTTRTDQLKQLPVNWERPEPVKAAA